MIIKKVLEQNITPLATVAVEWAIDWATYDPTSNTVNVATRRIDTTAEATDWHPATTEEMEHLTSQGLPRIKEELEPGRYLTRHGEVIVTRQVMDPADIELAESRNLFKDPIAMYVRERELEAAKTEEEEGTAPLPSFARPVAVPEPPIAQQGDSFRE